MIKKMEERRISVSQHIKHIKHRKVHNLTKNEHRKMQQASIHDKNGNTLTEPTDYVVGGKSTLKSCMIRKTNQRKAT